MKSGKALLGILIGTTAGALMGILFAPQKGADARKKIAKMGKDYSDTIKVKYDKTLDDITEQFKTTKDKVSDLARYPGEMKSSFSKFTKRSFFCRKKAKTEDE